MVKHIANINNNIVSIDGNGVLQTVGLQTSTIKHPTYGTGSNGQYLESDGTGGWSWNTPTGGGNLTNNSNANFNNVDVNGTLTINDITPSTSSSSSISGTTTLSQTLSNTNQRNFGWSVKITQDSTYIFTLEETSSSPGPNILIYKKSGSSYSLHQTISLSGVYQYIQLTSIDVSADGSILAAAYMHQAPDESKLKMSLYYYDSSANSGSGGWTISNTSASVIKTFQGVVYETINQSTDSFMSPNGSYMAFGNASSYVSGGSSNDGTVAVFEITGSGSSLTVTEKIEFTHQNNSGLSFGVETFISNNGYVLVYGYQPQASATTYAGRVYLYQIDFTANPVTATFKKDFTNPTSLGGISGGGADAFGPSPYIDDTYLAFCSYNQDNPETGTNNVGAIFVYEYISSPTNPTLIKDTSTSNEHSFFGGTSSDDRFISGQFGIRIKESNSKLFVFTANAGARTYSQNNNGMCLLYYYDISSGLTSSTWTLGEEILPPNAVTYGYQYGRNIEVSNDTFVIGAPGQLGSGSESSTQFIEIRTLDSTTTTTYGKINGTIGLNGGLALGSNADTGTSGQVLSSTGTGLSWIDSQHMLVTGDSINAGIYNYINFKEVVNSSSTYTRYDFFRVPRISSLYTVRLMHLTIQTEYNNEAALYQEHIVRWNDSTGEITGLTVTQIESIAPITLSTSGAQPAENSTNSGKIWVWEDNLNVYVSFINVLNRSHRMLIHMKLFNVRHASGGDAIIL